MSSTRGSLSVLLTFVLSFGFPIVPAQHAGHGAVGSEDNTVVVPDGPSDVSLFVAPKVNGAPHNASQQGSYFDYIDITRLVFGHETDTQFQVEMHVKSLTNSLPPTARPSRIIYFSYGQVNWRLYPGACQGQWNGQITTTPPPLTAGCLTAPGQRFSKTVPMATATDKNAYVFTLEKKLLFNENRVPARFGDSLLNITAIGQVNLARCDLCWGGDPTGGVYAYDRAPNDFGIFGAPFTFNKGSNGRGHLGLTSMEPIRVSNGEATTIVYKVDVTNHHTEKFNVQLETANALPGWSVRVPSLLEVGAQSKVTFPVILALPFTHDHGRTALFKLKAQAVEDSGSYAEVELGVFWTDVPQPSAHHEGAEGGTYFHSAPDEDSNGLETAFSTVSPRFNVWMNALNEDPDPNARDANVPALFNEGLGCLREGPTTCPVPPQSRWTWFFPLSPGLLLGLDYDLSKSGTMVFDILGRVNAPTAKVVVQLRYCDPALVQGGGGRGNGQQQSTGVCTNETRQYSKILLDGTATAPLSAGSLTHFEVGLKPQPAAEFIPYKKQANIGLVVQLVTDVPQNVVGNGPEFVTDKAHLSMPLIEYHDPIDQAFQNVGSLGLVSLSTFEKRVNPGRTSVFEFEVMSNATNDQEVLLEIQGVNEDWARIVGDDTFELAPREVRKFKLAVEVPADAAAEERAELFLVAQNLDDASIVAVTRLRATVVDAATEDLPDEADQILGAGAGTDTPGFGLLLAFAAAGAVGLVRRRRT